MREIPLVQKDLPSIIFSNNSVIVVKPVVVIVDVATKFENERTKKSNKSIPLHYST
jgi:hypothetical protein